MNYGNLSLDYIHILIKIDLHYVSLIGRILLTYVIDHLITCLNPSRPYSTELPRTSATYE